jgi:SAM-dependent methyltransferase
MDEELRKDLHEVNRISWNAATVAHNSHKEGQAEWIRSGGDTLFPEEVELLGDLAGKQLVHLQCNAGPDSLCLARRGATVTGVDISDEAIAYARQLSVDTDIPASFVRADVYDWLEETASHGERFDIAFSSYGALIWLSDIRAWAKGVARILKPGGFLAVVEFHPFGIMYNEKGQMDWPYFARAIPDDGIGDYVGYAGEGLVPWGFTDGVQGFRNPHESHEFTRSLADIVQAVIDAGLRLEVLAEYPYSNGMPRFENSREEPGRRFRSPDGWQDIPLMYAFRARRDA